VLEKAVKKIQEVMEESEVLATRDFKFVEKGMGKKEKAGLNRMRRNSAAYRIQVHNQFSPASHSGSLQAYCTRK